MRLLWIADYFGFAPSIPAFPKRRGAPRPCRSEAGVMTFVDASSLSFAHNPAELSSLEVHYGDQLPHRAKCNISIELSEIPIGL